ncbi:hypothetical protein SEA_BABYDAISY_40 [Microbacterium phage BabyDaisy]|uniref:hypothetical protein n=1 Tax=Microbacterium phage IndyLu TaxID=2885152 RepID=UPI001E7F7749|nr:hypothetical protein QDW27_gp40 [Microbacterium phage IndyLu]UDG78742.1 hypothetical protein SEA_INDYLU_40 [Microbacterium phage IndyLu]WNO26463.1 hypothetical protein SEA_BABYDAISY_40 [Microbacterium phage BabyDaisy]
MANPQRGAVEPPNPLDIIEAANSFADLAATFRDALIERDFPNAPAEMTALQIAAAMFGQVR